MFKLLIIYVKSIIVQYRLLYQFINNNRQNKNIAHSAGSNFFDVILKMLKTRTIFFILLLLFQEGEQNKGIELL